MRGRTTVTVTWTPSYRWRPMASWLEPIRLGLEPLVELRRAPLSFAPIRGVVPFEIEIAGQRHAVAVDFGDDVTLDPRLLRDYELVFKMQYLLKGYGSDRVVPGGFVPNALSLYRFLPYLRALRDSGRRTSDAYWRFGDDKDLPIRRRAVELLRRQQLFQYRGGSGVCATPRRSSTPHAPMFVWTCRVSGPCASGSSTTSLSACRSSHLRTPAACTSRSRTVST
jgi:hypothetical protein